MFFEILSCQLVRSSGFTAFISKRRSVTNLFEVAEELAKDPCVKEQTRKAVEEEKGYFKLVLGPFWCGSVTETIGSLAEIEIFLQDYIPRMRKEISSFEMGKLLGLVWLDEVAKAIPRIRLKIDRAKEIGVEFDLTPFAEARQEFVQVKELFLQDPTPWGDIYQKLLTVRLKLRIVEVSYDERLHFRCTRCF